MPTPTILIVDDEPDIVDLLSGILTDAGYAVQSAANGYEALARVAAQRPDLILLDLLMPGLSGMTVLAMLREQEGRPIPVLVLSAHLPHRAAAYTLGATAFIAKPFSIPQVLRTISQHL